MRIFGKLLNDKRGVGTIEYALVASLISVAALGAFQSLGSKVESSYANFDNSLGSAL
ncbi:MAG: Flp family type IVb pilin [Sphingomicrobium sp.]